MKKLMKLVNSEKPGMSRIVSQNEKTGEFMIETFSDEWRTFKMTCNSRKQIGLELRMSGWAGAHISATWY